VEDGSSLTDDPAMGIVGERDIACVLVLLLALGQVLFAQMLKAPFNRTSNTSGI
jgi:hypothetical protein